MITELTTVGRIVINTYYTREDHDRQFETDGKKKIH
jgi:hypothetical protein